MINWLISYELFALQFSARKSYCLKKSANDCKRLQSKCQLMMCGFRDIIPYQSTLSSKLLKCIRSS